MSTGTEAVSSANELKQIDISLIDDHPDNPRLFYRDHVIDTIAANLNGEFPAKHAVHVRPVGERYQLTSGHHRVRAAKKAGLDQVWAWVEDMDDEAAFMELVLTNEQSDLAGLEYGFHAENAIDKGKWGRSIRAYAKKIGRAESTVQGWVYAARVVRTVDKITEHSVILSNDYTHILGVIHKAPRELWPLLVKLMIGAKWSAADTKAWIDRLSEFDIPKRWHRFIDPIRAKRQFLKTKEFSPKTVNQLIARAEATEAMIRAYGVDDHDYLAEYHAWLEQNAGGESWEVRALEAKEREIRAEIEMEREKRLNAWNHGDWREHAESLENESLALLLIDPPYGIDYQSDYRLDRSKPKKHEQIQDDHNEAAQSTRACLELFRFKLAEDAHAFIFCHWSKEPEVRQEIEGAGYQIRGSLIWAKNNTGMGDPNTTFAPKHERIIHAVKGSPTLFTREPDVLEADRMDSSRHPTEKPVALLKRLIEATTVEGEIVADPFGGVASTLVAAKECGRSYWGCEVNEDYFKAGAERLGL